MMLNEINQTNQTNRVNGDDAYRLLAIAITRQAARDYQTLYERFVKGEAERWELETLEHWFTSPYGQACSFGTGELIIERIRNGEKVEGLIDEYQAI